MMPGGQEIYQTYFFLYLKETGPCPFPPFPSPGDYFGLPDHCTKPAIYLSSGIMKALAEMAFQKQRKLKFYLFTFNSMVIYKTDGDNL